MPSSDINKSCTCRLICNSSFNTPTLIKKKKQNPPQNLTTFLSNEQICVEISVTKQYRCAPVIFLVHLVHKK